MFVAPGRNLLRYRGTVTKNHSSTCDELVDPREPGRPGCGAHGSVGHG